MKLPADYYLNDNVTELAKNLLGKVLFTKIGEEVTSGIIVETEAYFGVLDKASHAFGGRRTPRTETMYSRGGISYVYLCYGMLHLFNVVSAPEGEPQAILIRAIEPLLGIDMIERRRNMPYTKPAITAGPGSVAKALGIDKSFNGKSLTEDEIWIEDVSHPYSNCEIAEVPRVGVAYAKEHALLPLRFYIKGNKYVSKPNKL